MLRTRSTGRPTAIDYLAAAAARLTPRAIHPAIDTLRLDARTLLGSLGGAPPRPFHDENHPFEPPPPLDGIDPIEPLIPRALRGRYGQLRRDVSTLRDRLAGRGAPPLVARRSAKVHEASREVAVPALRSDVDLLAPRTLRIADVKRETDDAISIVFEDPSGQPIPFLAGQFFTLLVDIDGITHRRAYSLSGHVDDTTRVQITVKRQPGGRVSNHLHDHVRPGQTLRVLGPSGNFTVITESGRARHHVLVAGGSGITPLMAIARAVLTHEPDSHITLLYGNRSERDVIFRSALADLAREHAPRFTVRHVLEAPPAFWEGATGILGRDVFAAQLDALDLAKRPARFYLCGPAPMMTAAREVLTSRGIPADSILEERFTYAASRSTAPSVARTAQPITFHLGAQKRTVIAAADQTLLEAGLAAGIPMQFSCTMGGCAACRVQVLEGPVEMEEPNCLSRSERDAGYVLACVGRATGPCKVKVSS